MLERPPIRGLFVGLTTLDLIYHAQSAPQPNEKVVAKSMSFAAGGPATNAAIAFSALGGEATLMSVVGQHSLSQWIRDDLAPHGIQHCDLMPDRAAPPTVSSIVVSNTGDRAVVSKNAQGFQLSFAEVHAHLGLIDLKAFDVILIDGHQMALSQSIVAQATQYGIPTVLDGGSWKPGSEKLLPDLTHVICSSAFSPPDCGNESETLDYLRSLNPQANLAITYGSEPVVASTPSEQTRYPCPTIQSVDTLGAGDFFHGAFSYFISHMSFSASIQRAIAIASWSCQFAGTREWIGKISQNFEL